MKRRPPEQRYVGLVATGSASRCDMLGMVPSFIRTRCTKPCVPIRSAYHSIDSRAGEICF